MPHTPPLFEDLLLILLAAVPVAFLCLKLRMPILVGLMLTGILIGPYGLGLIREIEAIEILAEIGVVLLLFTIGLEFSLRRLREMQRLVFVGGGLQVLLTILAAVALEILVGQPINKAIFFGFLFALSSTAIVLKSYVERAEVDAPHGRAAVGILIFQDLSIVLMMLLVPLLGGRQATSVSAVIWTLGTALFALAGIVGAGWFLVPQLLKQVVKLRSPEVFVISVVLICLGTSWLTSHFGLSLALGAFIAGVILADSEYSHQVVADILPFRDVFNSLFFISIGMLLSLSALAANLGTVLIMVVLLLVGKALIVLGVVKFLGYSLRVSTMAALGLAQIGEFSFVLAKAGRAEGLMPDADYQSFLAASIISMIAAPFLIAAAPKIGYFLQSLVSDQPVGDVTETGGESEIYKLYNHVIIVGYGLNGRNLSRVLRAVHLSYIVLEVNAESIRRAKAEGERMVFGDGTRREVLHHIGVERASVLVVAISDPAAARRIVGQARQMNPKLHIIVRTRYVSEIGELLEIGADEVIPEEFETSIEIFSRVLHRYGVARNIIERQIGEIRRQGYEMLRSSSLPMIQLTDFPDILDGTATETIYLTEKSPLLGKTLAEVNLRNQTGVTVLAAVRAGETKVNPSANFRLQAEDVLILLGASENIDAARKLLQSDGASGFNP
ncbi:MAG: cation:proton antiporter [Acidobacteriota bacterium]|nr:cation:proton antiporter [Acidobacteriota bacterium]